MCRLSCVPFKPLGSVGDCHQ